MTDYAGYEVLGAALRPWGSYPFSTCSICGVVNKAALLLWCDLIDNCIDCPVELLDLEFIEVNSNMFLLYGVFEGPVSREFSQLRNFLLWG